MSKTGNPEKDFQKTPEKFSAKSKITEVTTEDFRRGIILDSLEEFSNALFVYNGGSVETARETQNNLLGEVERGHGEMGVEIAMLAGAMQSKGFIGDLVKEATNDLKKNDQFHRSFDYDAMGTNFFKTTVVGKEIGEKYILELNAAYVGTKPESELAKALGKPLALVNSRAYGKLSVVDGWWFNADFENLLKSLPVDKKQIGQAVEHLAWGVTGNYVEPPEISFKYNGKSLDLSIGLDAATQLRPENMRDIGGREGRYFQRRGYSLVGGAWTTWDKTGNEKVAPRISEPSLGLYVSLSGQEYNKPAAVYQEDMELVQHARDYLANLIRPE